LLVLALVSFLFAQRWGRLKGPAHGFAALRTLGTQEEDDRVRCQDDVAHLFAPSFLGMTSFIRKFGTRFVYPGLYETVLATTRVTDDTFRDLINQNHFKGDPKKQIEQVVVLGADYGTLLVRWSQLLRVRGVKCFEVDLFGYQKSKLKMLKAAEKELASAFYLPDSIQYLEADKLGNLQQSLEAHSFQAAKPTLWVIDGVLPFVSSALVDSLLSNIRSVSGAHCCILLTAVPKMPALTESMSAESYHYTEQAIVALRSLFPKRLGSFEMDMSQVTKWCRARGFDLMKNLGPQAQQVQLLRLDGTMVGQVPDCLRILLLASSDLEVAAASSASSSSSSAQKTDVPKAASPEPKKMDVPKASTAKVAKKKS